MKTSSEADAPGAARGPVPGRRIDLRFWLGAVVLGLLGWAVLLHLL